MEPLNLSLWPQLGVAGAFIGFLIWLARYFIKENKEARQEYIASMKEMTKDFGVSLAHTAEGSVKAIQASMEAHEARAAERFRIEQKATPAPL